MASGYRRRAAAFRGIRSLSGVLAPAKSGVTFGNTKRLPVLQATRRRPVPPGPGVQQKDGQDAEELSDASHSSTNIVMKGPTRPVCRTAWHQFYSYNRRLWWGTAQSLSVRSTKTFSRTVAAFSKQCFHRRPFAESLRTKGTSDRPLACPVCHTSCSANWRWKRSWKFGALSA